MTTLTSAVSIGDNQLSIDTPLAPGQVPGFVKIDDELLNVGGQDNLSATTLVLSQPAQAEHDAGATVSYAGRPYDPTFKTALAGAGGEQTVRLLGPVTVAFDTPDLINAPGIAWGDLSAGAVVQSMWAVVYEAFDDGSESVQADLYLGARDAATHGDVLFNALHYAVGGSDPSVRSRSAPLVTAEFPANPVYSFPIVALEAAELMVYLVPAGSPTLTSGEADIYALIAEPAS